MLPFLGPMGRGSASGEALASVGWDAVRIAEKFIAHLASLVSLEVKVTLGVMNIIGIKPLIAAVRS